MLQCFMRQHFADRYWLHEHPEGHASWREPTMRKFAKESTTHFVKGPVCKWNVQKTRSESSEYVRKTTGFFTNRWRIKIALESNLEEHAKEVWIVLRSSAPTVRRSVVRPAPRASISADPRRLMDAHWDSRRSAQRRTRKCRFIRAISTSKTLSPTRFVQDIVRCDATSCFHALR